MTYPNDVVVHTVSFDRQGYGWTPTRAREWLRAEGLKPKKRVEHTADFLRYRIEFPDNGSLVEEFNSKPKWIGGVTMTVGEY